MTVIAMGLGYAISVADPTILSANMAQVRIGLHISVSTASLIASLATLTMAAAVLGAGTLGDLYGMRRMFVFGLLGTIVFSVLAAAAPSAAVLVVARAPGRGGSCVSARFIAGDHQRGVPAGSTSGGDRPVFRCRICHRHTAACTRECAGEPHRLARVLSRDTDHRSADVGHHAAVRAGNAARPPGPRRARSGARRRRFSGSSTGSRGSRPASMPVPSPRS